MSKPVWHKPVHLGPGFREFANAVAAQLDEEHKTAEGREREARSKEEQHGSALYFLLVSNIKGGVQVATVTDMPFVGYQSATGPDYPRAVRNLRLKIAQQLYGKLKMFDTWEAAREYATRYEFRADMGSL